MQIDVVDAVSVGQRKTASAWDGTVSVAPLPVGAQVAAQSSANQINANAVATLGGFSGLTNYVTGFLINVGGATAAAQVIATITGLAGGTISIPISVPAGASLANAPIAVTFAIPVPASGSNTPVVLTLPALGAGSTAASVSLFGYLK